MEAKHQRLVSKDEMLQMITQVQRTPEVRNIDEIFKRQKDILNREDAGTQKLIYSLSDFQKMPVASKMIPPLILTSFHLKVTNSATLLLILFGLLHRFKF